MESAMWEDWTKTHKEELDDLRKRKPKCLSCDDEPVSIGWGRKNDELYPLGEKCFADPEKRKWFDAQSTYAQDAAGSWSWGWEWD